LLHLILFCWFYLYCFSAPEVLAPNNFTRRAQRASAKADIWSLGIILYEMTYGTFPPVLSMDPWVLFFQSSFLAWVIKENTFKNCILTLTVGKLLVLAYEFVLWVNSSEAWSCFCFFETGSIIFWYWFPNENSSDILLQDIIWGWRAQQSVKDIYIDKEWNVF
jgi:serine/threonine protein kinase